MQSAFSESVSGRAKMPETCWAKSVLGSTGAGVCAVSSFDLRAFRPSSSARFGDAFPFGWSKEWSKEIADFEEVV